METLKMEKKVLKFDLGDGKAGFSPAICFEGREPAIVSQQGKALIYDTEEEAKEYWDDE
jgi:hypothetical protein